MKHLLTPNDSRGMHAARAAALLCAALFASHLAHARQQPTQAKGAAALTAAADGSNGNVAEGGNARGKIEGSVESEAGRPLANATVVARPVGRGGTPLLVSTDAEGRFQITDLAPAAYRLRAFAPGYVAGMPVEGSTQENYYRPGDSATLRLIKGGVITGVVADQAGVPLAAVRVHVTRVPDAEGRDMSGRDATTDDRGVYRVYGLDAGAYLVSVSGGSGLFNSNPSLKADEQPTFYPSSPRAAATKVVVVAGQEVVGINIQRRELRGLTVSGTVEGAASKGVGVALLDAATGEALETATLSGGARTFIFDGVPEGEYDLVARAGGGADESSVSAPRRVALKGRDLSGVALVLERTVVLAGRIVKPSPQPAQGATCDAVRPVGLREVVVSLRREEASGESPAARPGSPAGMEAAPDADGAFAFGGLQPGRYALGLDLPGRGTFVRSVSADPDAPGRKPAVQVNGGSLTLTAGVGAERLTIVLGEGAAELRGRVRAGEGARLPAALLVYLIPAAPDSADDPLRFALVPAKDDGAFVFEHVAPGSYQLVAFPADGAQPRVADTAARARLRREAATAGARVSLQPCQQVEGFDLPYAARASAVGERPTFGSGSY